MFVQAGLGVAGALVILVALGIDGFDDGDTLLVSLLSLGLAAALLWCAIVLPRRLRWVRITAIAIECVVVFNGLVTVLIGVAIDVVQPQAFLPIILGMLVIWPLGRRDVKAWFAGKSTSPS